MTEFNTSRVFRPDPRSLHLLEEHRRARFSADHRSMATVVITVEGEVDATNSRHLVGFIESHIVGSIHLVLDLSAVDFFGTAGFAALHNINVTCRGSRVTWGLQAGTRVRRLLEICDPDGVLPLDHVGAGAGDRQLLVGGNH